MRGRSLREVARHEISIGKHLRYLERRGSGRYPELIVLFADPGSAILLEEFAGAPEIIDGGKLLCNSEAKWAAPFSALPPYLFENPEFLTL